MAHEISSLSSSQMVLQPSRRGGAVESPARSDRFDKPQPSMDSPVTISRDAKLLQRIGSALPEQAEMQTRLPDHIRQEIARGKYPLDDQRLALHVARLKTALGGTPGHHIERSAEISRDATGREISVTTTDTRGHTRSLESALSYDRESHTLSRDVTRTGGRGNEVHSHSDVTRIENGFTHSTVLTTRDGGTLSRDVTQTYDPEAGTFSREVSITNRAGNTMTRMIEMTVSGPDAPYADPPVMPPDPESTNT